jgi:SAM-dependent methyltransferase
MFSESRKGLIVIETNDWERYYLPLDVRGMTVLDVGAGEGETAKFFLDHGAAKVVCIEPATEAFKFLKVNAAHHNIMALNKRFELSDLTVPHDFLKVDIEGYEEALLDVTLRTPAVVEVHGLQLCDKFKAKGYRLVSPHEEAGLPFGFLGYAYWI